MTSIALVRRCYVPESKEPKLFHAEPKMGLQTVAWFQVYAHISVSPMLVQQLLGSTDGALPFSGFL